MKTKQIFYCLILACSLTATAQVGINNTAPKATLDISANMALTETDGLLVPRVAAFSTTNPGADQNSMVVFLENNLTSYTISGGTAQDYDAGFYYWDNAASNWIAISGTPSTVSSENIYTDDGTLSADRTINFGASDLYLNNRDAGDFTIANGNTSGSLAKSQIQFSFSGGALNRFKHGITTQHNSAAKGGNNFRFMLWNRGVDGVTDLPTQEVLKLDGAETLFNENGFDIDYRIETDNHTDAFRIDGSTGLTRLGAYGAGTFTGTVTQMLGIDATGNIIETPLAAISSSKIIDADGDTQIQVEESADEDLIRFDLAGNERFLMTQQAQLVFTNTNAIKLGLNAGQVAGTDSRSIFIGNDSGTQLLNNFYNTAVGFEAMRAATGSNNNGARNNTAIGAQVLEFSQSEDNTGVGNLALNRTTTGGSNTGIGGYALRLNTTGGRNVGVGRGALQANTTGGDNTAVGASALAKNITSGSNTAVGVFAMFENISGTNNTAVGASSGQNIRTGTQNVSVGDFSLYHNRDSGSNVAIGQGAGFYELGANNTFVGRGAGGGDDTLGAGAFKTSSGNVMIGYEAGVFDYNGGNKLYIENSNSSVPLIAGDFSQDRVGINTNVTTDLTHTLTVGGDIKATNYLATAATNQYADYVFEDYFGNFSNINPDYKFMPLNKAVDFVKENGHLPNVQSYEEIKAKDFEVSLSEMSLKNLEKIEENFLYIAELKEMINTLVKENSGLKKRIEKLEDK